MTPSARVAAAMTILDDVLAGRSAEQALSHWARASRFAGSKDRAAVRDLVFDGLRCRASAAVIGGAISGRGIMLGLSVRQEWDRAVIFSGEGHGPAAVSAQEQHHLDHPPELSSADANDVPHWLWSRWCVDLGDAATETAQVLQSRAAVFLRVNIRRSSLRDALELLRQDGVETEPHPHCPTCLIVTKNPRRVRQSQAYADGLVEIQDAASQLAVASLGLPAHAGVLDFCAGGGGKALAIADQFDAKVTAHDISPERMTDIGPRAARAATEIDVLSPTELAADAKFDVVIVDAPCSGSGTWRRNPEAKWDLTEEKLLAFARMQDQVLEAAQRHVASGGQLVYMTCSVFRCENEERVSNFVDRSAFRPVGSALRLLPSALHDGFFCRRLS